jgi:hypothetical protein
MAGTLAFRTGEAGGVRGVVWAAAWLREWARAAMDGLYMDARRLSESSVIAVKNLSSGPKEAKKGYWGGLPMRPSGSCTATGAGDCLAGFRE